MISKSCRKRILKVMIVLFCFLIVYLSYVLRIEVFISEYLIKGKSLNYDKVENITYIKILGYPNGERRKLEIHDKEVIEEIFEYINSLKLVKGIGPRHSHLEDKGSIGIYIFGEGAFYNGYLDVIGFTTHFLTVCHDGKDWDYTDYYVKNSGYNKKDKSTKITRYIYGLLEDYGYLE